MKAKMRITGEQEQNLRLHFRHSDSQTCFIFFISWSHLSPLPECTRIESKRNAGGKRRFFAKLQLFRCALDSLLPHLVSLHK